MESRKYERINGHVKIKYHAIKGPLKKTKDFSVTRDLSAGGVSFKTDTFIPMAGRMILELDIPVYCEPIKAISKVAWIRRNPAGGEFEVGCQFLEISRPDKELLCGYISSVQNEDLIYAGKVQNASDEEKDEYGV